MIKRIIACLTICLIITGLISPVISHAEPIPIYTPNWNDPGIAEIINISDLTGWMANGGVYDLTNFQNLDEFLTWYFKIRVPVQDEDGNITFAPTYGYESYIDPNYTSPRFIEQSNIRGMIARSYQNKTGYGRRLQEQVDKALLKDGNLSNVNIPIINSSEAASFIGYNSNAINFYQDIFNLGNDSPGANPDNDYSFISNVNNYLLNGSNICNTFALHNWVSAYNYNYSYTFDIDFSQYTWVAQDNYSFTSSHVNNVDPSQAPNFCLIDDILTINLNSDGNNGYNVFYSPSNFTVLNSADFLEGNFGPSYYQQLYYNNNDLVYCYVRESNVTEPELISHYDSLNLAINDIYSKFCNINLYVEGNPWVLLSGEETNIIVPEFPDVVGGEELPISTWPLTIPKAPSYINLPGLRQAFQRAKNTDNQFDIMDLTDSLVDPEGDPIVDPEMETVPIPLPNPDPINPEVVPELPDLPLIPPANNPGFSGVSVLAEIINFTNQSLPSSLITVFWGIVFGVIILGLIKILHK